MKLTVKLGERLFEVEIANLHTRPIVATVEGETFEVWPETSFGMPVPLSTPSQAGAPRAPQSLTSNGGAAARRNDCAIYAPIPGVIVTVCVRPGDTVETGQEVCVLEAMKMKNSIRAPRAGEIGQVAVSAGDHVHHHDVLMEYVQ